MAVTYSVKSQDGRVISNLSVAEVKRLFEEGKINDQDMISKDGSGQWYPAYKAKPQRSEVEKIINQNLLKNENDGLCEVKLQEEIIVKQNDLSIPRHIQKKEDMSLREAIDKVLSVSSAAMHYKEIIEAIISEGLRQNLGVNPQSTVYNFLNNSIKNDKRSPYVRVGRGVFALKEKMPEVALEQDDINTDLNEQEGEEEQYEIITSFGMFWSKEAIEWTATPKLLGMKQIGATSVDFCKQLGIYLLYDGREVIYVGRSTDRPLGRRLYEHTIDRLSARWNRFSWFGLLPISTDGQIGSLPENYKAVNLIPALEAILIEALEPRQNRKRGDDLAAVEYLQQVDPEIEKKWMTAKFVAALNKL